MAPLMYAPSPGVVTINSRYARRLSTVCGIPRSANRLLQVGLLSSMASRPLSFMNRAIAVFFSCCVFISQNLRYRTLSLTTRVTADDMLTSGMVANDEGLLAPHRAPET